MDYKILEQSNPDDLFLKIALYIMQHELEEPILRENEVKIFILMNIRLHSMKYEDIRHYIYKIQNDLEIETFIPSPRPVHIGVLCAFRMISMISETLGDVVSRKYLLVPSNFDGLLFSLMYEEMQFHGEINYFNQEEATKVLEIYKFVTSNEMQVI